ncbi:MAG: membrane dipeptidase [Proteobacteria bacterium]|nr:membrane dipeptidase [Pseudomonadota bacterium]
METRDPAAWARDLGISREAVEIYLESDVVDLHLDTFIWNRLLRYDLRRRHGQGPTRAHFLSQVDFPRVREARLTGGTWVITTNPWRRAAARPRVFLENVRRLQGIFESVPEDFRVVRNVAEYRKAVDTGRHAAFLAIQGGNALDRDLDALDLIPDDLIVRITLVHLSTSKLGTTSAPTGSRRGHGLTDFGREYVRRLDEKRILVDLAHINRQGFFDAVETHDRSLPLIVTHTGVCGVTPHWRNLDDEQLRAVADSGGTIGIMYQSGFLGDRPWSGRAESVVRHLAHVVETAGEDHASLGSDWDGAISPPRDLRTPLELPRLVEIMLGRGWGAPRIQKILGGNFLRTVAAIRG